jgi:hypothetical protein
VDLAGCTLPRQQAAKFGSHPGDLQAHRFWYT